MTFCVEVFRFLETEGGALPPHLAEHAASCPACQTLLASWPDLKGAGATVRTLTAPPELVEKLLHIPRLPQACEAAAEAMGATLDQEVTAEERRKLLAHLPSCPACRATWEGLATLKQVGSASVASGTLKRRIAAKALPQLTPPVRRARWAAAALYILAGALALLSGQGEWLGRGVSQKIETAFFFARAAVVNRLQWAEKQGRKWLSRTHQLAKESLSAAFDFLNNSSSPQNPKEDNRVPSSEEEGES